MSIIKIISRIKSLIVFRFSLTAAAYLLAGLQLSLSMVQPLVLAYFIDHVLVGREKQVAVPLLLALFAIALLTVVFLVLKSTILRHLDARNSIEIRERLVDHLRKTSVVEIEKNGPGKYQSLFEMDTGILSNFFNNVVVDFFINSIQILICLGILFYTDYRIGITGLASGVLLLVLPRIFKKTLLFYSGRLRDFRENIKSFLYDSLEGSREIRVFGLEKWEREKKKDIDRGLVRFTTREALFRVLIGQTTFFLLSVIVAAIYWIGSRQVLEGRLSIGILVASITYLNYVLGRVMSINTYYGELQKSRISLEKVDAFLEIPAELEPQPDAAAPQRESSGRGERPDRRPAQGRILGIDDLHVSLDGVSILKGVSLEAERGQNIALVGPSGSGKSTLFKVLVGFISFERGEVTLNGVSLQRLSRQQINAAVGIVFQESHLFRGTVYENIAVGDLSATEEQVYLAACEANLKELIDTLPEGLHARLDSKGYQLSGGEKQRIAIARVMLKRPEILLLDEPTSALDKNTERDVIIALERLMRDKTTVMATHRLEAIKNADAIYVIDSGAIVEHGNHEQLISNCSRYYQMFSCYDGVEQRKPEWPAERKARGESHAV